MPAPRFAEMLNPCNVPYTRVCRVGLCRAIEIRGRHARPHAVDVEVNVDGVVRVGVDAPNP